MAGQGFAPKFPEQRRNTTKPARGEWVEVFRGVPVPPLPVGEFSARAVNQWEHWWSDPAASQWSEADFAAVVELLHISELLTRRYSAVLSGEQRHRMDGLGLTQKGKRDLRLRVVAPPEDVVVKPRPAAKRRTSLKVV